MRILFLSYINTPEFNDPKQWLRRIRAYTGILEQLAKKFEVISIEQINYSGEYFQNGVQYVFLNYGKKKELFPKQLHTRVKELKPDIVFIHSMNFPFQILQLRRKLGTSVPIIVQNHAEKPWNGWRLWLQRRADRVIDAYLFTSRAMAKSWEEKYIITNAGKVHEVMEASSVFFPIDNTTAKQQTKVTGEPVFLWVGRLDANKDPLTVVRAFLRFAGGQPNARLYMIFHTDELLAIIKNEISRHPHGQQLIQLVGKVEHEAMQYWFNSAAFIIAASYYEGSGVAVCEAMSCGCIPIVTGIDAFRKLTNNGACGRLYEVGNEEQLVKILNETRSIDLAEEKEKVLHQFHSQLSFEAIASGIERITSLLVKK